VAEPNGGSSSSVPPPDAGSVDAYTFGAFRIDLSRRQLVRDNQPLTLSPKTFDALTLLVRHHDRVVGKDELMSSVWPDSFVSEDSLTQNISALRRALGDDPSQPKFIATVARRGYRFIAAVVEVRDRPSPMASSPMRVASDFPEAQLETAATLPAPTPVAGIPTGGPLLWAVVAGAAILLVVGASTRLLRSSAPPAIGPLHFTQDLPGGTSLASGGLISPDSRYLAFVAQDENSGKTQLWLRSLDSSEPRALEGTEGASRPFWSPDSQFIGFFAGSKIKRIGVTSGPPQTLTPTVGARPSGGTWASSGLILYADSGSLCSVPAAGGRSTVVLEPASTAQEVSLRAPQFLPDGRHFLYVVASPNPERAGTYVGSLDSKEKTRLLDAVNSSVTFTPPGHLTYVREHLLMSQPFDVTRFALAGDARTIAGNVSANPDISASAGGLLAYGGGTTAERLVWFDRSGERTGAVDIPTVLHNLTFSPDQKQLLGSSVEPTQSGVWLVDLDRGVSTRFVPDGGAAAWSPDGTQITFTAARLPGAGGIYLRSMVGRSDDELASSTSDPKVIQDWSPEGRYVVYVSGNLRTKNDLWLLPRFGDRKPVPFLTTPANEIQAQVSPNGRWIAYASDESGAWEVNVQSFPMPGAKRTISPNGGTEPQWRGDGKELFYLSPDHMMTAVDIDPAGATLQAGKPKPLFRAPVLGSLSDYRNYYAVTSDGRRFLIDSVAADSKQEPITVLVNWTAVAKP